MKAWYKHPGTFFGVIDDSAIQPKDPIGIYELVLRSYSKTSKEQLLVFMATAPDIDQLRQLDQASLAREYSIRIATAIQTRTPETPN
ncbi:hypothetical protein D3C84_875670 [compost metagenome]